MRVLLRVLVPLLGLTLAAAGMLLLLEVLAAWARPGAPDGLVVPWVQWRSVLEDVRWAEYPVPAIAIGAALAGLLLTLVGLLARRSDIPLDGPADEVSVTTSPRMLARWVGRRVRASDDVAGASVTASRRKVSVTAQAWNDASPHLRDALRAQVDEQLTQLPLRKRPRVAVSVQQRRGPR